MCPLISDLFLSKSVSLKSKMIIPFKIKNLRGRVLLSGRETFPASVRAPGLAVALSLLPAWTVSKTRQPPEPGPSAQPCIAKAKPKHEVAVCQPGEYRAPRLGFLSCAESSVYMSRVLTNEGEEATKAEATTVKWVGGFRGGVTGRVPGRDSGEGLRGGFRGGFREVSGFLQGRGREGLGAVWVCGRGL